MLRVLSVASEIFPLLKTGGLADVTGALPAALAAAGARVTTVVPGYPAVMTALADPAVVHRFADLFGAPASVLRATVGALDLLVVDAPHLFAREGNPYLNPLGGEWADNGVRFAGLGAAAAALAVGVAPGVGEGPGVGDGPGVRDGPALPYDILHAHDWQAAMAPVYLHFHAGPRPGTVMTVHNMAFQGRYRGFLFPRLGLPQAAWSLDGLEYHGDVNFLKGGLAYADRLTTVSPTYAREITELENGMGLDGLLRRRAGVLSGIVNGIDDTVWNPATDRLAAARFTPGTVGKRAINKAALQRRIGLAQQPDALLIGAVSRLTSQKGLDMVLDQLATLRTNRMQLALLGSGEPHLQDAFMAAARDYPDAVGCVLGYDEALAHLVQAGSDAILVPSRFEPCGLTQLYALRYGAVPVVSRVGGLADTVIDANQAAVAAGVATGIQFWPPTAEALRTALLRLLSLWHDRPAWARLQRNAMAAEVSWKGPAQHYMALYQDVLAARA